MARLDPQTLRPHYSQFLGLPRRGPLPSGEFLKLDQPELDLRGAPRRILLTGHSHQAWPDVAREGLLEAFTVAAEHIDDKWGMVFEAQDELRSHIGTRIGCAPNELAFAGNTHELVARFLSALPLARRPHLVTTSGEFHSAFRQLRRLAEEGVDVTFVDVDPIATLSERLLAAVRPGDTSAILTSTVMFGTSSVVPNTSELVAAARQRDVEILLDAYHAFDVVPFEVPRGAFVVAGGYKYAQWGEGMCFLRVPTGSTLRPVYTGWFAGFAELADRRHDGPVGYADDGATRFAGSTFDPSSTFRARAVARFFERQGMSVAALRETSLSQTARILARAREIPHLTVATPLEDAARGGFVALRTPRAGEISKALREDGVLTDSRGDLLRLGPAPYVTDVEIDEALDLLARRLS